MIPCALGSTVLAFLPVRPFLAQPCPVNAPVLLLWFFGPFILAAVLLIAAMVAMFWKRWAAGGCLLLTAGGSFLLGYHLWWEDQRPVRERHARWVAEVAADPVTLGGSDIDDEDLKLLRTTTHLVKLDL